MLAQSINTQHKKRHPGKHTIRRSRKKRKLPAVIKSLVVILLLVAGITYIYASQKYQTVFLPQTTIIGLDVSGMNLEQAKESITLNTQKYTLTLETRDGNDEEIRGWEIALYPKLDGTLETILENQKPLSWGFYLFKKADYNMDTILAYDEEKLKTRISALTCLNPYQIKKPVDAHLNYTKDQGFIILPEEQGNELVQERLVDVISNAILNAEDRISLEDLDLYKKPQILEHDTTLKSQADAGNQYIGTTITYRFGNQTEILDRELIHQWLLYNDQGDIILDQAKVSEYIKSLAKKYNTAYSAKKLKTSYGPTVTIKSGNYGWMINQEAEVDALMEIINSQKSQEREPIYRQKAASHDSPDYGNTYVELNLTAQHMFFYKNGKLLIESDFVSGNEAKGWSTPAGTYPLTYKQLNATLRGKNYATPVTYWMPFNGNIGMHDGYWRSSFGGTIYKNNGSHGCVNLPPSVAKFLFEHIEAGMPVLCYHLDGTEKSKPSVTKEKETTATVQESTAQALESTTLAPENTAPSEDIQVIPVNPNSASVPESIPEPIQEETLPQLEEVPSISGPPVDTIGPGM